MEGYQEPFANNDGVLSGEPETCERVCVTERTGSRVVTEPKAKRLRQGVRKRDE